MNYLLLIALSTFLNGTMILPSPAPDRVVVRDPMMRLVRPAEISLHCGKGANIEACTAFVGQRLECACSQSESGWRMESRVHFIPVMFVTGARWAGHEREHVDDIRVRVEAHLQALDLRRFVTSEECLATADHERNAFPELMDRLKLESNAAMHPRLARASSD